MTGRPLRLLAFLFALAAPARAAVTTVPALEVPVVPTPVVAQLALDLSVVSPTGAVPTLATLPTPITPALWSNLTIAAKGATPSVSLPTVAKPSVAAAAVRTDALKRIEVAQSLLGHYEPGAFEKLEPAERDAALAALWDGWKAKGLVEGGNAPVDELVLAGVDDKRLTAANKSVFLGVAVLGYPLEDALWLSRTRIQDAIDENTLRYPSGQKWHTADHTPEFLGISKQSQGFVDAWGDATAYAKQIVAQVRAGSKVLPKSAAATPEAAAAFARVAEELRANGDEEALEYLTGRDPTFSAFLLDARKPGYYLYNGDGGVIGRIMRTEAAGGLGVRRVLHPVEGLDLSSTYFYRPRRVLDRLRELETEPGGPHSDETKALLKEYEAKLAPLVGAAPKGSVDGFVFAAPETLEGAAGDSPLNALSAYPPTAERRWDLPLPASSLYARVKRGEPHPTFDAPRWKALVRLLRASKRLASWDGDVRFVSERWQTKDRLVSGSSDGRSVLVQLALLDEVDRRSREAPKTLASFLRFAGAALDGAVLSGGAPR